MRAKRGGDLKIFNGNLHNAFFLEREKEFPAYCSPARNDGDDDVRAK